MAYYTTKKEINIFPFMIEKGAFISLLCCIYCFRRISLTFCGVTQAGR